MPERRSALAAVYKSGAFGALSDTPGLGIREVTGRDLVQFAGWPDSFEAVASKLSGMLDVPVPEQYGVASTAGSRRLFLLAPERLWIVALDGEGLGARLSAEFTAEQGVVTELGHSRTVLRLSGPAARRVLAKGLPVDLDDSALPPGAFAQSAIHHISLLLHRLGDGEDGAPVYELYVARGFAVSFWDWLTEAATEPGYRVEAPAA